MGKSSSRRGDLRIAQTILVTLLVCMLLVIVAEFALRLYYNDAFYEYRKWGNKKSVIFGFEPAPDNFWKAAGATYSTDHLGFRTHVSNPWWYESANDTQPGLRIFSVGGSSTFGYGLMDDETWTHLLERKTRSALSDSTVFVINAGANGFNSLQTMLRFYLRVLPHHPTHVIFYEARNDASPEVTTINNAEMSEKILFSNTLHDYLSAANEGKNVYLCSVLFYKINWLFQAIRWQVKDRLGLWGENPYDKHPEILVQNGRTYIRNLTTLADMCRRDGTELVLVTFLCDEKNMTPPYEATAIKYYNELLRNFARIEGLQYIDLEKSFSGIDNKSSFFFGDHYHPTRKGAEWISSQIAEQLSRIIRRRSSSS